MILLTLAALLMADPPARGTPSPGDAVVVSALTTEQLVAQCRGKDADPTPDFCTGYILGAFDTLSRSRQICPSSTRATTVKVLAIVRKYLRTRGKTATGAPAFVVRDALQRAYPCKRK
ncbi:Rap1a/Tai family immunity protein [Sphingomonas sp. Leaf20]|jgi:stage V sporulation protein SpoVS|uniref:Rap1a/Tai family immunity protein n=1 Tax=Sphingomonas sp. Leaf20 TaxID=1735685 RepID=UPI0006FCA008|nr:Rap1a/Tai family immunity protein [Sphingomonas sp. Leaf20]KQM72264.1 hypothetical protein ASE72_12700 [Sphingomonas sp. Leaf20]